MERCVTAGFQQQPGWVEQLETVVREKEGGRTGRVHSHSKGRCKAIKKHDNKKLQQFYLQYPFSTGRASNPAPGWRWQRQAWLAGGMVVLACLVGVAVQGWRYYRHHTILRQERAAQEAELLRLLAELAARTHVCGPEYQVILVVGCGGS